MPTCATCSSKRRSLWGTILLAVVVVLIASACLGTMAHASGGTANFSLQPAVYDSSNAVTKSYFVLPLHPGTVRSFRFRVINSGTRAGSATLSPVDATTG